MPTTCNNQELLAALRAIPPKTSVSLHFRRVAKRTCASGVQARLSTTSTVIDACVHDDWRGSLARVVSRQKGVRVSGRVVWAGSTTAYFKTKRALFPDTRLVPATHILVNTDCFT